MKIQYVNGDAAKDPKQGIIAHIVNNRSAWGKGFVLALSNRWPVDLKKGSPEWCYRGGCDSYDLGDIQMVSVPETGLFVCNMFAQKDFRELKQGHTSLGLPNLNYSSLYECLLRLRVECGNMGNPSIHMPPIGSGLAGGSWPKIEGIINQVFEASPFSVNVYRKE